MSGIVGAIRGGPGSQPTIDRAVSLAKEKDLPVHFLYVVNLDFLAYTESSRIRVISHEMDQMGEFILLNAQAEAEAQGVEADGTVRHGTVADEIIGLSQDLDADYVVLGRPRGEQEKGAFTQERFTRLSQRIEDESGAKIVLTEGEEE